MLYHPNSGYYRQFLTASAKQRNKRMDQAVGQTKAAQNMPSTNPSSVGL